MKISVSNKEKIFLSILSYYNIMVSYIQDLVLFYWALLIDQSFNHRIINLDKKISYLMFFYTVSITVNYLPFWK